MKIYYFSGTHWDREWYQTFQEYRMRLVDMVDELIEGLETNKEYGVWHFDGQTVVLEDYLEIRPENRERLSKLIQEGKIVIGPWYCMPDEFCVSGESLIKNLRKGFKISREYGVEPMKYGYICDIFGHMAQMPQIFKGFNINHALLGRGTNERNLPMHFNWQSPNGDDVITFKVTDKDGYTSFTVDALDWGKITDEEELKASIKRHVDGEIERANAPAIILMDATDHRPYDGNVPKYIKMMEEMYPDAEFKHCHIQDYLDYINKFKADFPTKEGELCEPGEIVASYICQLQNCISSRYPLKKENDMLQIKLEKVIAPLYVLGLIKRPKAYLDLADKFLLQNHPHDSICGCSIDQVHKDCMYRFDQANEIVKSLWDNFEKEYAESGEGGNLTVKVFNPLPYEVTKVIDMVIDFPQDFNGNCQGVYVARNLNNFKIYDAEGNELVYALKDYTINDTSYKKGVVNSYTVSVFATLAPACFTEFTIEPVSGERTRYVESLYSGYNMAENEHIVLEINDNGTLNITDKKTCKVFTKILTPVDDGEIGNGWTHFSPDLDKVISGTTATFARKECSLNRVTFEIVQKMELPKKIDISAKKTARSDETETFVLKHEVSLEKGARYVKVKTNIENNITDHRLRMVFPSGVCADDYYANQSFCFVNRKRGLNTEYQTFKEQESIDKNMDGIIKTSNADGGLAVISPYGIREGFVDKNGDVYITLFRSYFNTTQTNGEPGGQLLCPMEFDYIIAPIDNDVTFEALQKLRDINGVKCPMLTCKKQKAEKNVPMFKVKGEGVVYSTANVTDFGREIRVYNMSAKATKAEITFGIDINSPKLVNFDGDVVGEPEVRGNTITFDLGKWQIATLSF